MKSLENPEQPQQVVLAERIIDCAAIFEPGHNIAIVDRNYTPTLRAEFEHLNESLRGDLRGPITRTRVMGALDAFLAPFCDSPITLRIVCNELTSVIHDFMTLTEQLTLQITFGQITTDHCRLFHADHNHLRLLCTYAGRGTEWLKNEDVHRGGLGTGTNAGYIEGRPIQRLSTYQIAIIKGDLFPGNEGCGLVHRSPPMDPKFEERLITQVGSGSPATPRIFLALDAVVSNETRMRWRKLDFPAEIRPRKLWRAAEAAEGIFLRTVRARFARILRDLEQGAQQD